MRLNNFFYIVATLFSISGCVTTGGTRIDNIPMYGQPEVNRPAILQQADKDFIEKAVSSFGTREEASKAWFMEAEKFISEHNFDYAMRRYNQSWLLDPNNYQPYWGFGRIMLELDELDKSIVYFEKAIKLCKDIHYKVALLSDAGTAYSYKAESISTNTPKERDRYFSIANDRFVESSKLDDKYGKVWLRWSHSLYRQGKFTDAWKKLKKARLLNVNASSKYLFNLEQKMPEPK